MAFMSSNLEHKQILRDNRTGRFFGRNGDWTEDEGSALNCLSAARLVQLRLEHGERDLEIVLKRPGRPDERIAL